MPPILLPSLVPFLGALIGGLAIATQIPLNAALARSIGGPLPAATVSFGVGFLFLLLACLLSGASLSPQRLVSVPLWQLAGGLLGAIYVFAAISTLPSLGAVTAIAAIILGQMLGALVLDHIGAFGMAIQEITPKRLFAVALVAGGLVLSRL